jgi:uncharacterized protein (TIGR02594 family)
MTYLPPQYAWLEQETGPAHLVHAVKLYGIKEAPGALADNPVIIGWAKEVKLASAYMHDVTPWCGLFMAVVFTRAGRAAEVPDNPLWALNWRKVGELAKEPKLGDIGVKYRAGGGGHVCMYVGEDDTHYHVLGGNQGDSVGIVRIEKHQFLTFRRPAYKSAPKNIRRVLLSDEGTVSTKEA